VQRLSTVLEEEEQAPVEKRGEKRNAIIGDGRGRQMEIPVKQIIKGGGVGVVKGRGGRLWISGRRSPERMEGKRAETCIQASSRGAKKGGTYREVKS